MILESPCHTSRPVCYLLKSGCFWCFFFQTWMKHPESKNVNMILVRGCNQTTLQCKLPIHITIVCLALQRPEHTHTHTHSWKLCQQIKNIKIWYGHFPNNIIPYLKKENWVNVDPIVLYIKPTIHLYPSCGLLPKDIVITYMTII